MKTITDELKNKLDKTGVHFDERIFLYRQYEGVIESYNSSSGNWLINLVGDATDFFSDGDIVLVPMRDFIIESTIISVGAYSSIFKHTPITIDNSLDWSDSEAYKKINICKRYNISEKLIRGGVGNSIQKIEGQTLNSFDSGKIDIEVDNKDGYFINKNKTGLLNTIDVYWCRYLIKVKEIDEEINYFGGILSNTESDPNLWDKTIVLRIYGHTYELKRYPAYELANFGNGIMPFIGGMTVTKFIPSENSQPGIKNIRFNPFNNTRLKGITVESVSIDTVSGIYILEFRYPYWFRWDNGEWYKIASVTGDTTEGVAKLESKKGANYFVTINFGTTDGLNEFPLNDTEIWVNVKDEITEDGTRDIGNQGRPSIIFDDGVEENIKIRLQRNLTLASGAYTDITSLTNEPTEAVNILEANGDSLLLISPDRFWGVKFLLSSFLDDTSLIEISYSVGGEDFSVPITYALNNMVDETNSLRNNGSITWGDLENWFQNEVSDVNGNYKGYMIKITRVSGVGVPIAKDINRIMRVQGVNGDFLEFNISQELLSRESASDEIIISKDVLGEWSFGTWYQNTTFQTIIDNLTRISNYTGSKLNSVQIKSTTDSRRMNIWGRIPYNIYTKNPTAMFIDWINETLYIAIGLEIWKSTFSGNWEFVTKIDKTDFGIFFYYDYHISRIFLSGDLYFTVHADERSKTKYLSGLGGMTYYLYKYNFTSQLVELQNSWDYSQTGKSIMRDGEEWLYDGTYYHRSIGSPYGGVPGEAAHGENLIIPFPQIITSEVNNKDVFLIPVQGTTIGLNLYPIIQWIFKYVPNGSDPTGLYFNSPTAMFLARTTTGETVPGVTVPLGITFNHGFQGNEMNLAEIGNEDLLVMLFDDSQAIDFWEMKKVKSGDGTYMKRYNRTQVPYSTAFKSDTDKPWYFGWTQWYETGSVGYLGANISCSFISKFHNSYPDIENRNKWNKVYRTDSSMNILEDWTNIFNNNTGDQVYIDNNTEYVLLLGDMKWISFQFTFFHGHTFEVEYWNGTTWETLILLPESSTLLSLFHYLEEIPHDWVRHSSFDNKYAVRIKSTIATPGNPLTLLTIFPLEMMVWDSSETHPDETQTFYEPVQMVLDYNNNNIHGCMFNRSSDGIYPLQWLYFVLNLDTGNIYYKRAGINFTFDGSFLYKDFVYDDTNDMVFLCAENIRYKDRSGFLLKGEYNNSTNDITLTRIAVPHGGDYGSSVPLLINGGRLFGITKGTKFVLWEYWNDFYLRNELMFFNDSDSFLTAIESISQIANLQLSITSERKMNLIKRDTGLDLFTLDWDKNFVINKPDFHNWQHYYDLLSVKYENPFSSNNKGDVKKGFDGWLKKKLSISNNLIQNYFLADIVSDLLYNFFNYIRLNPKNIKINLLLYIELLDKFNINIPVKIAEIDNDTEFLLSNIQLTNNKEIIIEGLELGE